MFFPTRKGLSYGNGPVGERYRYLFLKALSGTYQGFRGKIKRRKVREIPDDFTNVKIP